VRVLYVNHTAHVSGGERSLLDLLAACPSALEPCLAAPPGRLTAEADALGVPVSSITGTDGSLRLHPLRTPRALAEIGIAAVQVRRAAQRYRADVVHANSIRAGIVLALARPPGAVRVAHVRDCLPPGPSSMAALRLMVAGATRVIANSRYTANCVRAAVPSAQVEVLYNPVDLERFDPRRIDRARARSKLGAAGERELLLGVIGQLSPWKGQDTAIEALRLVRERGTDAHLLVVGETKFVARATRFDNRGYVAGLRAQVARAGLEERVSWLGEREDVPEIMRALDALLLPSWEEPFGRAAIEAMAMGVPVIATNVGGPCELIDHGSEGFLVPPRSPQEWAQAISVVAGDRVRAGRMGEAGLRRARAFSGDDHALAMLDLYRRILGRSPAPAVMAA
jgi:L-malate glycosyltransferase